MQGRLMTVDTLSKLFTLALIRTVTELVWMMQQIKAETEVARNRKGTERGQD